MRGLRLVWMWCFVGFLLGSGGMLVFGGQSMGTEKGSVVWVEAESLSSKGGWVVDGQFTDLMGSPYLMAHGLGKPVADASGTVVVPRKGLYFVFVRTYNWVAPWHKGEGPGKFSVWVNGKPLAQPVGFTGENWQWQKAGQVELAEGAHTVALRDESGFNGRCDALLFTSDPTFVPSSAAADAESLRSRYNPTAKPLTHRFDFVVSGGGVAGVSAAVAAARLGLKVALIQDRPVLGGNNSSEVRVHLGGRIAQEPYPKLGALVAEMGPVQGGNAQPASYYEDDKKLKLVQAEPNITLFLNHRVVGVKMRGKQIAAVVAREVFGGKEVQFSAPLFADCTGDATVGYLAGADFTMGREGRDAYGESTAPLQPDAMTMGSSVQWYSVKGAQPASFPQFSYGLEVTEQSAEKVTMGEWTWETGMTWDQISEFEKIRDYGLLVVFSNWSFLKNRSASASQFANHSLDWVAYVAGKRESRRLLGDYVLKEQDLTSEVWLPDGTASTTWSIDLHYPDSLHAVHFPEQPFKSIAVHKTIRPYPIPYRCFYSRNVPNLFMAGRNISVSHVALGTIRVMRTTGMMGEVVGMAASICHNQKVQPRVVYQRHLAQLKALMQQGVGSLNGEPKQRYNQGSTLGPK